MAATILKKRVWAFVALLICTVPFSFKAHAGITVDGADSGSCQWKCELGPASQRYVWTNPTGCPDTFVCRRSSSPPPAGFCTAGDNPVSGSCEPTTATYLQSCQNAGIPTPPPIDVGPWTVVGTPGGLIPSGGSTSTTGTLLSWRGPNGGICLALQRDTQTGIICSNADSSKACFFNFLGADPVGKTISQYQTPTTSPGMDNCTSCHQGNSPFLQTASLAAMLAPLNLPKPSNPYDAVAASASWNTRVTTPSTTSGACRECHTIQLPNDRWCLNVAIPAISSGYMPPPPATPDQEEDATAIMIQCCNQIKQAGTRLPAECGLYIETPNLIPTKPSESPVMD